jgi:hypothetical protein
LHIFKYLLSGPGKDSKGAGLFNLSKTNTSKTKQTKTQMTQLDWQVQKNK